MSVLLIGMLLAATPTPKATPVPTPMAPLELLNRQGGSSHLPRGQKLSDVAKGIKLKLPPDGSRRLDNDAVKRLAQGVELTTVMQEGTPTRSTAYRGELDESRKRHWQQAYLDAQNRVKALDERVTALQGEVARLQRDFYSRDDPAYRDGVIKPAWDKALADLAAAKEEQEQARDEPQRVMAQADREGALPGWFREPMDLTPPPTRVAPPASPGPGPTGTPARRLPATPTPLPPHTELE